MNRATDVSEDVANRIIRFARDLVGIPTETPPGDESHAADRIAAEFRHLGDTVVLEGQGGRPTIVATLPGTAELPSLMLNSHIDVVPAGAGWSFDPYSGEVEGGWLLGRGAADAKGSLAAMVGAAAILQEIDERGDILLAAVADEEGSQAGTKLLLSEGYRSTHAVVGEPTGLQAVISQKGQIFCEIEIRGKAAHSSAPERGLNAIHGAADVIHSLSDHARELSARPHPLVGHPTLNVGTIAGGTTPAAVPDRCMLGLDRRTIPGESADAAVEGIRLAAACSGADLEVRVLDVLAASEVPADAPVVRAACRALEQLGRPAVPIGWAATCDANLLINANIPTVILGPGDLSLAHGPDERCLVEDILTAAAVYAGIGLELWGHRG